MTENRRQEIERRLREARTPCQFAKAALAGVKAVFGKSASEAFCRKSDDWKGAWEVVWEGGPFEWAVWLTGGGSMYCGEFERIEPAEFDVHGNQNGLYFECQNSFTLVTGPQ